MRPPVLQRKECCDTNTSRLEHLCIWETGEPGLASTTYHALKTEAQHPGLALQHVQSMSGCRRTGSRSYLATEWRWDAEASAESLAGGITQPNVISISCVKRGEPTEGGHAQLPRKTGPDTDLADVVEQGQGARSDRNEAGVEPVRSVSS